MVNKQTSEQLRLRHSAACKTAATIFEQSKKSWEEVRQKLVTNSRSTTKYCGKSYVRRLRGKRIPVATFSKDANGVLLKHQKGILNRGKEYLNPITAQHLETSEEKIGEEIYLTEAEMSTAMKSLKAGKARDEDDN